MPAWLTIMCVCVGGWAEAGGGRDGQRGIWQLRKRGSVCVSLLVVCRRSLKLSLICLCIEKKLHEKKRLQCVHSLYLSLSLLCCVSYAFSPISLHSLSLQSLLSLLPRQPLLSLPPLLSLYLSLSCLSCLPCLLPPSIYPSQPLAKIIICSASRCCCFFFAFIIFSALLPSLSLSIPPLSPALLIFLLCHFLFALLLLPLPAFMLLYFNLVYLATPFLCPFPPCLALDSPSFRLPLQFFSPIFTQTRDEIDT